MTTNWYIDKEYLKLVVEKGYSLLNDPKIPSKTKKGIKTDVKTFNRFINNIFENLNYQIVKPPHDVEKLKSYILKRMKEQYCSLGEETILWTMDLCYENIFQPPKGNQKTKLTLDQQIETTIETYSTKNKEFLETVKKICSNQDIRQIQEVPYLLSSPYCYCDEITELPYLIINPNLSPSVTAHEIEHAIEYLKKIKKHKYYSELGAILAEQLFNDTLYKKQGFLNVGDYKGRMSNAKDQLLLLYNYFGIMLEFKEKDFEISTDFFLQKFQKICTEETKEELIKFLREEIAPNDIAVDMTYLYSYLKAIELREEIILKNKNCTEVLQPYFNTKKFIFTPTKETFNAYKRFNEEMISITNKK